MNEVIVNGTTSVMGYDIPIIEGGFGEGQKTILARTIAEIHETRINDIQDLINKNIEEFEFGIDILDLKVTDNVGYNFKELGFTKMQVAKAKNIYLLSEQGYMLLVGFMRTKKAKEIRKQLRREYFSMREELKLNQNNEFELLKDMVYQQGKTMEVMATLLKDLKDEIKEIKTDNLIGGSKTNYTKVTYKNTTVKDDFNLSRFEAHINNLSKDIKMTKKEYVKLFNSYDFYHKNLGIMALNRFMVENNLQFGNDRVSDYSKEHNLLTRIRYKNHNAMAITKDGILYITNLIINNMPKDYTANR